MYPIHLLWIALFSTAAPVWAASLPVPSSTPILIISGDVGVTNLNDTAQFDRSMLEQMTEVVIETKTPWHDGVSQFAGVSMADLMKLVGASGNTLTVVALNDYVTDIPISDFDEFGAILAFKRNGTYMSIRDKGPLFIIYPYDSLDELRNQTYYGRSAWQVSRMIVR
jgi:hypothetical protein